MSGLDERPVKKREKITKMRQDSIDMRLNDIVSQLRRVTYEDTYTGFPALMIIAEFVVGVLCLISGIMAVIMTSELWLFIFVVMGILMLKWGINDRKGYIEWEERQRRRNMEPPYPYMRRLSAQDYEEWVFNERNRRNAGER